jgi:hypothetical protein
MLLVCLILMLLNPPAWLLVAGWRVLPAPFIASEDLELAGSLSSKLSPGGMFTNDQRLYFAGYLLDGMHRSETARWDARRGMLLDACVGLQSGVLEDEAYFEAVADLGQRHTRLLDAIGLEIVAAAADQTDRATYEAKSRRPQALNFSTRHPYLILRHLSDLAILLHAGWTPGQEWPAPPFLISLRQVLMPHTRALGIESTLPLDRFRSGMLLDVALDAGFAGRHAMLYFPAEGRWQDSAEFTERASGLSTILATQSTLDPEVLARLGEWVESGRSAKAGFAFAVVGWWCDHGPAANHPPEELAQRLLASAVRSISDQHVLYSRQDDDYTVRQAAQFALVRIDRTGARSLPLVRDWLLKDGEFPVHARYDHPEADPDLIASWAEHLSDLAWSEDVEIRRWLAPALPIRTGTPADARIAEVIAQLLADEDEDVRREAGYAAEQRREAVRAP